MEIVVLRKYTLGRRQIAAPAIKFGQGMAGRNGVSGGGGEETPLLRGEVPGGSVATDDGGSGGINGAVNTEDGHANQQVARGRGLLIILSLYGLIFLQGMLLLFSILKSNLGCH